MFRWIKRFKTYRILRKHALPDEVWHRITHQLPLLDGLDASEKARLRVLSTLLIHRKTFTAVQGEEIDLDFKIVIAAQACLEILYLDIDAFDGWYEVVIYPGAFVVARDEIDEIGIVHPGDKALSGEAWMHGPVIFSRDDIERDSFQHHKGHHVVLHEFAHKLDMLNGRANGMPPLHPDMPMKAWTQSLSEAYDNLVKRVEHHHGGLNPYAATNPAEFFAVICEYFFTAPEVLHEQYPKVYHQLKAYFRQDPLRRLR